MLSYEHLLATYQEDMEVGRAATHTAPLAPTTINRRMSTVCDFLSFASGFGMRGEFEVSYQPVPGRARREGERRFERRVGRVRQNPQDLRLPTRGEIKAGLDGIKKGHRESLALPPI